MGSESKPQVDILEALSEKIAAPDSPGGRTSDKGIVPEASADRAFVAGTRQGTSTAPVPVDSREPIGRQHIVYVPHPDATPESEAEALAQAYRYILRCHEEKKAAEAGGGKDAAEGGDDGRGLTDTSESSSK
jgi:hypothetical protein